MVKSMLDRLNIPNKETRFIQPPRSTYVVWFNSQSVGGCDNFNAITTHNITIELYEYSIDNKTEKLIEDCLNSIPLEYTKQERTWINNENLFQVIYEFTYIKKECIKHE